jgi:hypothetical protein
MPDIVATPLFPRALPIGILTRIIHELAGRNKQLAVLPELRSLTER